jgi:hypothetical protein
VAGIESGLAVGGDSGSAWLQSVARNRDSGNINHLSPAT